MIKKTLKINGVERILILDKDETLAQVLRNHLLLTGCKIGCGEGHCGACNVIMNGKVTRSCIYKMSRVPDHAEITTIEGVGTLSDMHPIQVAWMAYGCAQCGFCSPGFIISAKVLLDNNPSPTREEVRDWFNKQRNLCRCTGYKPLIDATMAAAAVMRGEMTKEDLVFKQTGDSIVGTNYIRPSAAQKVTGTWDFGADDALKMPSGTLRLALTQAKVSHANILSIDTTEAESMPGVVRVITAKDIKAAGGTNKINGLVMLPKHNKTDGFERPVLCDEKIFQFGDAIAIVAADTEEHARAAAEAVKVEIEELPAYMNAMDAIAPDAAEIHPGTPNAFFETNCIKGPDFDWDSIPDSQQVEIESYCSRQPHLHLEPDCGYGYIDEDGMITVHSKSIGIHLHMPMIADGIGVPMENLRIVQNHAGGTFGYKFSPTNEALIGAAVKILERPVSLVFNQFQNITYTGKRSPAFMNIKLAADENGKILKSKLEEDKISTECVFEDEKEATGMAFIMVNESGNNSIVVVSGSNMAINEEEIDTSIQKIKEADIVIAQFETAEEMTLKVFKKAKELGKVTILNPAPAKKINDELLKVTDIIVPNETEAEVLTGVTVNNLDEANEAGKVFLEKGVKFVVITLGSKGAAVIGKDFCEIVPAYKVNAIDTTAAGDSFIGGVSSKLDFKNINKENLIDAVSFGNKVSSIAVQRKGAQPSIPYLKEVKEVYGDY